MLSSKRRHPFRRIIVMGMIMAVAFLIYDQQQSNQDENITEPLVVTATPDTNQPTQPAQSTQVQQQATPTSTNNHQGTPEENTVATRAVPTRVPPTTIPTATRRPRPTQLSTRVAAAADPNRVNVARAPTAASSNMTLFIPSAGISTSIIDVYLSGAQWNLTYLGFNAGHLQGTADFNQGGNVVLAGHVETTDGGRGPFDVLDAVQVGDIIIVSKGDEEWRYVVREQRITAPDDISVLFPTSTEQLTLITCGAYNLFDDIYEERIVVIADRV